MSVLAFGAFGELVWVVVCFVAVVGVVLWDFGFFVGDVVFGLVRVGCAVLFIGGVFVGFDFGGFDVDGLGRVGESGGDYVDDISSP